MILFLYILSILMVPELSVGRMDREVQPYLILHKVNSLYRACGVSWKYTRHSKDRAYSSVYHIKMDTTPSEQQFSSDVKSSLIRLRKIAALNAGDKETIKNMALKGELAADPFFLHTAVQLGSSVSLVDWILTDDSTKDQVDINASDLNGNTPLHLAAMYGKKDIALLLLSQPKINDAIVNKDGRQPVEVARTTSIAEAMQVERAKYVGKMAITMKRLFAAEDTVALDKLLSEPRAGALLDLNGHDPDTGSTVLHDYVRKKNLNMVRFLLDHGADPLRRDSKGQLPSSICKDDAIKKVLKAAMKDQQIIPDDKQNSSGPTGAPSSSGPITSPPFVEGYLNKWTNFTGGYKLRWFVLKDGVLSYYKRSEDTERACRGSISLKQAKLHLDSSEKLKFDVTAPAARIKFHLKGNHPIETSRWVWALTNAIQYAKDSERKKKDSIVRRSSTKFTDGVDSEIVSIASSHRDKGSVSSSIENKSTNHAHIPSLPIDNDLSLDDDDFDRQTAPGSVIDDDDDDFEVGDSEDSRLEQDVASTLFEDNVGMEIGEVRTLIKSMQQQNFDSVILDALKAMTVSLDTVERLTKDYVNTSRKACLNFQKRLVKTETKEKIWAKTLRDLELEHEKIQGEFYEWKKKAKGQGVVVADGIAADASDSEDEFYDLDDNEEEEEGDDRATAPVTQPSHSAEQRQQLAETAAATLVGDNQVAEISEEPSDWTPAQKRILDMIQNEGSFLGYEDPPRKALKLKSDDRPKISLWGILKNLIGKDMTRMTLPVSFNECTNLLQRSAEDMEYTNLLDKACQVTQDPGLRMAYVAAFAGSSYSSTIDRIAKPFNPLLGETFEYARPDQGYRLFAEQVSHHPPIGAMLAESPRWSFYGHSHVDSKFYGRSFDIKPLGLWYLVLRPNQGAGIEEEVYSFRKVTSSVVGIITGSPVVDNHGDMEITNHTLGYKCIVTYKSRGWRGAGAYELKGTVTDDQGSALWNVGGRWNDKIFAKKHNAQSENGSQVASPQIEQLGEIKATSTIGPSKLLLWHVHDRPRAPFNLTPFAITLNALPDRLKEYVAASDTRLRPDQRAMEEGRYDDASDEKNRVEVKQRKARKEREQNGTSWEPVWFEKAIHPVTNQEYYKPRESYWEVRKQQQLEKFVPDIF